MEQHYQKELGLFHQKLGEIVRLYQEMERCPRKYGTEEYLTGTEIHLIEAIGYHNETASVTDLAEHFNVTKGAVSQNLKKLEKKGLTLKISDPQNASRSLVGLTSKGKAAFYAHKHWHEVADGGFSKFLDALEERDKRFILSFMEQIETFLTKIIHS